MTASSQNRPGNRRSLVEGATLGGGVILVALLVAMVNYLGGRYFQRFDWTASRLYTLSEKSRKAVAALDKDIEVTIFMRPGSEMYDPARELLARYQAASPRIQVRTVDPEQNLLETQRLVEKGVTSADVVVFESEAERRVINQGDLADYDYSGMQFGEGPRMTGFKGEQRFTGALLELAESRKPRILFTAGHGEASLQGSADGRSLEQAQQLLGRDNFELEEWSSLGQGAVPEGADLVVIAGPTQPFVEPELAVLGSYLDRGGRLLVLLDPVFDSAATNGLERWLAGYGAEVGRDVVVDPSNPLPFFGAETIFSANYGEHPTVDSLRDARAPVVFSLARSVGATAAPGWTATSLVETSAEGWGERDLANLRAVQRDDGDLAGPVPLAVAIEAESPEAEAEGDDSVATDGEDAAAATVQVSPARLAVFGDADWATDTQIGSAGNATLLADTMNWLVARPQLLGIDAKAAERDQLRLSAGQLRGIFWTVVGLLPGLAILAGTVVHFRRRR